MSKQWLTGKQLASWLRLASVVELLPGAPDSQLRRDAVLTLFEYSVLAMLSETPARTLRVTALANTTLPRLSHVVRRLDNRGLVDRFPCPEDKRPSRNPSLSDEPTRNTALCVLPHRRDVAEWRDEKRRHGHDEHASGGHAQQGDDGRAR